MDTEMMLQSLEGGGGQRFIMILLTASVPERNRQHCCRERGTEENGTGEGKGEGT